MCVQTNSGEWLLRPYRKHTHKHIDLKKNGEKERASVRELNERKLEMNGKKAAKYNNDNRNNNIAFRWHGTLSNMQIAREQ